MTGAAGFIGSHLADRLQSEGHDVVGIDNLVTGRRENFTGELHEEDIADRNVLYGIANNVRPELVVHCAASYSNPNFWHRDTDTNVTGTINTTLVAMHHGCPLVYFQTALPPISSYAISKIAGEQYITLSGVPATIFRLANMYGPRNVSGPIPTFWKRLTQEQPCTVVDTRRDMVYVSDLIDACMSALKREAYRKFDVCSGRHLPIADLYDAVASAVGSDEKAEQVESGADDVKQMELDGTKTQEALGWQPRVDLADGVARAVEWYAEHGIEHTYTHLNLPERATT